MSREIIPKKKSGRVSFSRLIMLNNIFAPSLNVFNLLWEFAGRSKYADSIYANGIDNVRACMLNSASISNPLVITGKVFTNLFENAR